MHHVLGRDGDTVGCAAESSDTKRLVPTDTTVGKWITSEFVWQVSAKGNRGKNRIQCRGFNWGFRNATTPIKPVPKLAPNSVPRSDSLGSHYIDTTPTCRQFTTLKKRAISISQTVARAMNGRGRWRQGADILTEPSKPTENLYPVWASTHTYIHTYRRHEKPEFFILRGWQLENKLKFPGSYLFTTTILSHVYTTHN